MNDQKKILGFVGDLAAGKGTVCKYLKEKYGINSYRYSTALRDVLKRLYLPETRDNMQRLSTSLRETLGQDLISKIIAEDVSRDAGQIVAVEGIRRFSDITYLEKNPGFNLTYITADPKIRWERLVNRGENPDDAHKTFEQFLEDEQKESDHGIKEVGQTAKLIIRNDGNFEELKKQIDQLIGELK